MLLSDLGVLVFIVSTIPIPEDVYEEWKIESDTDVADCPAQFQRPNRDRNIFADFDSESEGIKASEGLSRPTSRMGAARAAATAIQDLLSSDNDSKITPKTGKGIQRPPQSKLHTEPVDDRETPPTTPDFKSVSTQARKFSGAKRHRRTPSSDSDFGSSQGTPTTPMANKTIALPDCTSPIPISSEDEAPPPKPLRYSLRARKTSAAVSFNEISDNDSDADGDDQSSPNLSQATQKLAFSDSPEKLNPL